MATVKKLGFVEEEGSAKFEVLKFVSFLSSTSAFGFVIPKTNSLLAFDGASLAVGKVKVPNSFAGFEGAASVNLNVASVLLDLSPLAAGNTPKVMDELLVAAFVVESCTPKTNGCTEGTVAGTANDLLTSPFLPDTSNGLSQATHRSEPFGLLTIHDSHLIVSSDAMAQMLFTGGS